MTPSNPSPAELSNRSGAPGAELADDLLREPGRQVLGLGHRAPHLLRRVREPAREGEGPHLAVGGERPEVAFVVRHDLTSSSSSWLVLRGHRVEVALERVEAVTPRRPVRREPLVDLLQRLGPEPVDPALGVGADLDHSGVAQHPQVLRHRGLADVQRRHQVADRALPLPQEVEDPAAVGLGEHLEHGHYHARPAI